ncbi:MAG: AMP-binding protein [Chloroflexi bacterium]|nr:AMP-binding protein [Chloroflexota bacterium]
MAAVKHGDFFDDLEIMSPAARENYAGERLRETVAHAYRHASAARGILDKAGVSPDRIRTPKDLEKLPITRKADLIELQKARPPYGGFLAIPPEDVERVFISPGPIYEPLQPSSIKWFAKSFYAAGFRKGDIVVNTFTYHMSPAGILFHEGIRDCGATVVVMGTGNTEIQVQTMRDLKVTGFVGTPTFLMTVIKRAEELGHRFREDFSVKRAWFTGEMLTAAMRRTIEEDYGISTCQAYAVTEPGGAIAYECPAKAGMHFMDEYIVEIVDPETGRQLGPGETGEIVVTPVHNRTWGLLRFGTGDLSSFTSEPCPCGRTAKRLVAVVGRTGDAVKVRGMFVVAKQAETAILSCPEIGGFQITVRRPEFRDELTVKLELRPGAAAGDRLAGDLRKKFRDVCRVDIDRLEFVGAGALGEGYRRIVDERAWK